MFDPSACTAVITGASSGLGAEFARQLAPQAGALLLAARSQENLDTVAEELRKAHPALKVHTCACDVSTPSGRTSLLEAIDAAGLRLNLLINNAGVGDYGPVETGDAGRMTRLIDLNITGLLLLTHALIPRLIRSVDKPAGILNVSSLASVLPLPGMALYAASKSFVTSLSEAMSIELAAKHVAVTCVCPGPTPTRFSATARRPNGEDTNREGDAFLRIPPTQVVSEALGALRRGKACVFPGRGVRIAGTLLRIMPRPLMRWILRRRYAKSS